MAEPVPSLQAIRVAAGLSQNELAQHANVSLRTVQILEVGGSVDPEPTKRLADALSTTIAALQAEPE